jgi:uncharacterized protein YecE (DUF72 family)
MIKIGTSGFSYPDWIGPVYPEGLPEREHLGFYAREFSTVEINMTYYRVPDVRTAAGWARRTPEGFHFAVKAYQGLTHGREQPEFSPFVTALQPLIDAGKLACVLAQFPYSFHPVPGNRDYLKRLRDGFGDLPVVVEFRHAGWVDQSTFDLLRSLNLGFCSVDEPHLKGLMPPVAVATGHVAYVRFHGRNAAKWYNHEQAWERYNYTYSQDELREWLPRLRQLDTAAGLTLVYFNNHYVGQAVRGARDLGQLLLLAD